MSRRLLAPLFVILGSLSFAAFAQTGKTAPAVGESSDPAVLEKAVIDAPGPVGCYYNVSGDRLLDCEAREKGLNAFKALYKADPKRAIAALQRRFDEIPSPKGGYFPILVAAKVKDKAFVPMLKKLTETQKENVMGNAWAPEAISVIETGKCTRTPPVPSNLREICE